jgi:hypothetical protein
MPAERPEDAPPREVAAKSDGAKSDGTKSDGANPEHGKPAAVRQEAPDTQTEEKPAAQPSPAKRSASTKKRR